MRGTLARRRDAGFTLVEAVLVIAVTGILSGMVAMFIKMPVQAYADTAERADMAEVADTAIRRISRDLRLALPNSVVVNGQILQFLITKTGGRYLSADDGGTGNVLDFDNAANKSFTVLGTWPDGRQAISAGDFVVVGNYGNGFSPADAYTGGNVATVASTNSGTQVITLATNPFASQDPPMESPTRRFQVVSGTVWYQCSGGVLTRYYSASIAAYQAAPSGTGNRIADNVQSCVFSYSTAANTRIGLVGITLTLSNSSGSSSAVLSHQVHMDNTP